MKKLTEKKIAESAGKIIYQSGLDNLSVDGLAGELRTDKQSVEVFCKNRNDILVLILVGLENEISRLFGKSKSRRLPPEKELNFIFKNVYQLFNRKPFYTTVIFLVESLEGNPTAKQILTGIKMNARIYLIRLINRGKKDKVFTSSMKSGSLVNVILGSFRLLINQELIADIMAREIEEYKTLKDLSQKQIINI
ncbi:MAG: hypothetical protein ABFD10_10450 [Prolixibacteraceae bacterium]